jgi:hypothetical protein
MKTNRRARPWRFLACLTALACIAPPMVNATQNNDGSNIIATGPAIIADSAAFVIDTSTATPAIADVAQIGVAIAVKIDNGTTCGLMGVNQATIPEGGGTALAQSIALAASDIGFIANATTAFRHNNDPAGTTVNSTSINMVALTNTSITGPACNIKNSTTGTLTHNSKTGGVGNGRHRTDTENTTANPTNAALEELREVLAPPIA